MIEKFKSESNNIKNLDAEASRLGIGGNSSSDGDEEQYKKRMIKRSSSSIIN